MNANVPFVSVVTPVHNGEKYLAECVESVLAQAYQNWEYLIVDNRSADRTREIAEGYARMDRRIQVHHYEEFVDVIQSHNRALRLISPDSNYCKVVSADDYIYPECIARMVDTAEANPTVGIVGAYQLSGDGEHWEVRWAGLPYRSIVVSGRDICRANLLGGPYIFGNPTSSLYRADLVRGRDSFYPNLAPYADVSAYFEYLQNTDYAFVHQVLSYERVHEQTLSTAHRKVNTQVSDILRNLLEYGPVYLTKREYEGRLEDLLRNYYRVIAAGIMSFKDREFWTYQKKALKDLGYPFYGLRSAKALGMKTLDLLLNPKQTIEKLFRRLKG